MLLWLILCGDSLGKKGIKIYKRGPRRNIKVGFFYFEVILSVIDNADDSLTIREMATRSRLKYTTVRHIVNKLTEMNRLKFEERKVFNGPTVRHYSLTEWKLK